MVRHVWSTVPLALAFLVAACGAPAPSAPPKPDGLIYEDTRRLVRLVDEAAALIAQRGAAAFAEFGRPDSPWRRSSAYLFVYEPSGICAWHGGNAQLIGRNLLDFRDALGKPVVQLITEIARQSDRDASEWIFYLWEDGTDFLPTWKSSYVRKAIAPDGTVYLVGAGSSLVKMEKVFVQRQVDAAARLLREEGREAAFRELRKAGSRFYFLETFVFVLDGQGRSVVDPAFPTMEHRDMANFRDAVGRPVLQEVMAKLETSDAAWVQFLWPKPGRRLPSRKLMYVRKVEAGGQTFLIGSDFFPATPIWMRG
jgi:signal transduction histidine kinase